MKKKKLLNLEKLLRTRGDKAKLAKRLNTDPGNLTRLINCQLSIESYKLDIYRFIQEKDPNISMENLFAVFEIEEEEKPKPENYDSPFAQRVRIAIDKQKAFYGFKSDNEIVESKKLISIHAMSDYKNGYSECRGEQLEQLAITLNVIPQYLSGEIALPYDYKNKEILKQIHQKFSDFVLNEYESSLEDFLNECYQIIYSDFGLWLTLPDKALTNSIVLETVQKLLEYICKTQSLDYETVVKISGSPEEIIQKMRDQIANGLFIIESIEEQKKLVEEERMLFEWYKTKAETTERDLLILRSVSSNSNADERRDLINNFYAEDLNLKRKEKN